MSSDATANAKIVSLEELLRRRESARRSGEAVVQCHGCFDLVHPGHIHHLQAAARFGDVLLVSVTGDGGVAASKGPGRPIFPQRLRAENLAALDCVQWVHIEPAPTAERLLERVRPDVYAKGQEYEHSMDPRFEAERRAVERHGGRVVFTDADVVYSSSALINEAANRRASAQRA